MSVRSTSVEVRTEGGVRLHDVTEAVRRAVGESGIREGLAYVGVPHSTCGICVNEDEAGLRHDIERLARDILSPLGRAAPFEHDRIDDNARAHLTSLLFGHQTTLAVRDGAPVLGTWQSVFLVELDGPRRRRLDIQIAGD